MAGWLTLGIFSRGSRVLGGSWWEATAPGWRDLSTQLLVGLYNLAFPRARDGRDCKEGAHCCVRQSQSIITCTEWCL